MYSLFSRARTSHGSAWAERLAPSRAHLSIVGVLALLGSMLSSFILAVAPASAFTTSAQTSFTLEGCRNDGSIKLPINGKFICPDAAYTTGNLGKGWNELDLVPHRLTSTVGNQAGATTDYNAYIAADYQTSGRTGYDVISVPVVNAAKSDASCTVSAGPQSTQGSAGAPFGGGTDVVIYRLLTIHQDLGTTCVFDYYQRLALGSHLYPGSSLQSYMFEQDGLSGGKRTLSIPVKEIAPQSLNKDMTATQGSDHVWNIVKGSEPATLSFADTCSTSQTMSAPVQVTVTWTKQAATPNGPITVVTHVYATNPAARDITTTVTDRIYSGTTLLDTSPSATANVPANTANFLMLTHTVTVPAGTANLNDVATATYTDTVTGITIPGDVTATASATVQLSGTELNKTATIKDVESITGTGLQFSADSFTGATGAFDGGYVAGTPTTGPVSWTSTSQAGSGSVTFNKTVYASAGTAFDNGLLSDQANLTGSNGFTASATASTTISAGATLTLTINKTMQAGVAAGNKQAFLFDVYPGSFPGTDAPAGVAKLNASPIEIDITPPATSGSATFSTPATAATNTFTIVEEAPAAGWTKGANSVVTITLPDCAGSGAIPNTFSEAVAQVTKTTLPAGHAAGWKYTLTGPNDFTATGTTGTDGSITWTNDGNSLSLPTSGDYTITETPQDGWFESGVNLNGGASQGAGACTFTVSYPADAGKTFACNFTNTELAAAAVVKTTVPSGNAAGWLFTLSGPSGFTPVMARTGSDGTVAFPGTLPAGDYTVAETTTAGWIQSSVSLDGTAEPGPACTFTVSYPASAGHTFVCTFANVELAHAAVHKATNPAGAQAGWQYALTGPGSLSETGTTDASGNISFASPLGAGTYTITETAQPGWNETAVNVNGGSSQGTGACTFTVALPANANQTFTCNFTNTQAGRIVVAKVTSPTGSTQSFAFTPSYGAGFSLTGGQSNTSGFLVPGTYSVSEATVAGWTLTSATCSDGSPVSAIALGPGETVTCTFTNTQAVVLGEVITPPAVLPRTGAPLQQETEGALLLVLLGGLLVVLVRKSRPVD